MKSYIIQRPILLNNQAPKQSFCSAKLLASSQKMLKVREEKEQSKSHGLLIPRQQSQKLQKERPPPLTNTPTSERAFPHKMFFKGRKEQKTPMQSSEQLPKKINLQLTGLMASSEPPGVKTRESYSTQPQSPKSTVAFPRLRDYLLIRRIGEGRFGSVYLAVHKLTGFIGAIKVLKKSGILDCPEDKQEKIMRQIISQIKIQAFLSHPNLVRLYDCFSDRKHLYLFVELGCQGHLYGLLQQRTTISQEATSLIVRQVALGIAYMHSKGVIHRDIKLENIVFTHVFADFMKGMAKICDFGWAVYEPQGLRNTLCGTPLYLAPEMLRGKRYDSKVDLWALGTLAHQLFTSENPFKIASQKQLKKILTDQVNMSVGSPEIRSFIGFILKKNPERRPDAEIILMHPFIKKYQEIETCEQVCCFSRNQP